MDTSQDVVMEKDVSNSSDSLIEEFELLDDIPTLTDTNSQTTELHDYNPNCTCINCCAHRVIEASIQKKDSPRITSPQIQKHTAPASKKNAESKTDKKSYGSGIKMDNVTFTSAWDDWE